MTGNKKRNNGSNKKYYEKTYYNEPEDPHEKLREFDDSI